MRRTQLYLDEPLWLALHLRARAEKTTVSELARQALRQSYLGDLEHRRKAMQAIVGLRKGRQNQQESRAYIRSLRRGNRLEELRQE